MNEMNKMNEMIETAMMNFYESEAIKAFNNLPPEIQLQIMELNEILFPEEFTAPIKRDVMIHDIILHKYLDMSDKELYHTWIKETGTHIKLI